MSTDPPKDLEIRILSADPLAGSSPVVAVGPDDRRGEGTFHAPFADTQVDDAIAELNQGRLDSAEARTFGADLFRAIATPEIKALLDAMDHEGRRSPIRLIADDPGVARLPWELMFDPAARSPVVLQRVFVRGLATDAPARPMAVKPPLRVLLVAAAPTDVPLLESQPETEDIRKAMETLSATRKVLVETLNPPTVERLLDVLREARAGRGGPIHVLHWIGHGGLDPIAGGVSILFEDERGLADPVDGPRLAALVAGSDVRLVYLNACYSAAASPGIPDQGSGLPVTVGMAESLLISGVPAVIGMQTTVLDQRARRFARDFYRALADGVTIGEAMLDARRLVRDDRLGPGADIGVPVCYLRSSNAVLIEPPVAGGKLGRAQERLDALPRPLKWIAATVAGALLGSIALGLIAAIWATVIGPTPMEGDFNVAVTEFNEVGPNGENVHSDRASALSRHLAEALGSELAPFQSEVTISLLGPDAVGRLDGSTPEERTAAAQTLAQRTNADIVIYGALAEDGTSLVPEFYIERDFLLGAEELVGTNKLGSTIASVDANPNLDLELRQKLQARAKSLALFVLGLTYLSGRNFVRAEEQFGAATADAIWPERDGKEVMYLFKGTAAALDDRLADAKDAFDQALQINPEYARAKLGLAGVAMLRGHHGCTPTSADEKSLRESHDLYRAALTAKDQPPVSNVPAKAHLGIGRVAICLSQAGFEDWWVGAAQELRLVVSDYESGNDTISELAGQAHAELATVYLPAVGDKDPVAEFQAAAREYQAAIALTESDGERAFLLGRLGWVMDELGDTAAARDAYARAAEIAPDAPSREMYERHVRDLKSPAGGAVAPGSRPAWLSRTS